MSDLTPRPGGQPPTPAPPPGPQYAPEGYAQEEMVEGIHLREVIAVLRRHVWLVVLVTMATLGIATWLVLSEEPEYRAQGVLRLEDTRGAMTGGIDPRVMERMGGRSAPDPMLSQLQVLRSRAVLGRTVDDLGLRLVPANGFDVTALQDVRVAETALPGMIDLRFVREGVRAQGDAGEASAAFGQPLVLDGVRFTVMEHPGTDRAELEVVHRERAIEDLAENLRARPREETDVVDVEFTAKSPERAQAVVNSAIDHFRRQNVQTARQQSERRRIFVEEQLAATDSMLAAAQHALADFRTRERVFSSQEWFAAQQAGMMTLEMRREELDADRRMYRSILQGIRGAEPGETAARLETLVASPEIAANPVVASNYERLVRYETARDSLVSGPWGRTIDNPDVARLDQQITSTTRRIENAVRSHLEAIDARLAALDNLYARSADRIEQLPATEAEEARLIQQMETVRGIADQLREEYQRARISEAVEAGQVEVLDYAAAPLEPVGSRRSLKLALGLVLGVMLGGGGAFLLENLNTSIRRREDLEETLQIPSLAMIPQIRQGKKRGGEKAALPAGGNGKGKAVVTTGDMPALVTISDVRSSGSEAFRSLRTNLLFSDSGRGLRKLLVTSTTPSEGKTTTTANLAVTYAQQGMRVLVIDCDLRKPRLHAAFGTGREPGLTQLVLGYATAEEVVRETPVENLYIIPAGTIPPNPTELLGGARMRETLEQLAAGYDMVILDTSPITAGADAAILGAACDGVLMVVRAGKTDRDAARQALGQLSTVGARVLGGVLNDPDAELPKYGGYYGYYEYYGEEAGK